MRDRAYLSREHMRLVTCDNPGHVHEIPRRAMKVLLVNGSARVHGNTAAALQQIAQTLETEGIDTQIFQLDAGAYRDCIACNRCSDLDGHCVFDDDPVNEFLNLAAQADGFVFWHTGLLRASFDASSLPRSRSMPAVPTFAHKPGASIAVARRAGTCASVDVLNKYFTINQMPVVSSHLLERRLWRRARRKPPRCRGHGNHAQPGPQHGMDAQMHRSGAARASPREPERERTNFIR